MGLRDNRAVTPGLPSLGTTIPVPDPTYNPRWVGWLSLGQLISWGSIYYLFALIMLPIEEELGLSRAQSSLAFSLALLVEGLLAYPVGRWLDRGHERWVMTAGSILLGLCLLAHSFVTTQAGFYAVWSCIGLGMAATLYNPAFAVVTRRFPQDFRRAIITLTFLGGLASTVFLPLSAWLINHNGWRHALLVLAALHLLVVAPLHFVLLKNASCGQTPGWPEPDSQPELTSADAKPAHQPKLAHHLTSAPFLLLGLFVILTMTVTAALPTHIVSMLRELGLDEAWAIAIPASIGLVQVLGRLLLYFFEHRFNVHTSNRLIPWLLPLGLVALLIVPMLGSWSTALALPLLFFFVLMWGMGVGMLTIVKGTAMAQYVSREHVASLNGAIGVPLALARASAPLGLGLLWSAQTGYSTGLWVLLGVSVASALTLHWAQRLALKPAVSIAAISPQPPV
jgi:MFS family permease